MLPKKPNHYINLPSEDVGFSVFHSDLSDLQTSPRRTHCFLLVYCQEGEARIVRDMQTYTLSKGMEWTLLPDNILHVVEADKDFRVFVVCCTPNFMDEVMYHISTSFLDFLSEQPPYQLSEADVVIDRLYMQLVGQIYDDKGNPYRRKVATHLLQAFYIGFYGNVQHLLGESKHRFSQKEEITKRFHALLLKNFREHHDVEWYANELCITCRYLNMAIKEITGQNPKKLIDDYMLLEIQMELKSSNRSIQQIAEWLNFSDQSALGRFFKNKTGVSPQQYRSLDGGAVRS